MISNKAGSRRAPPRDAISLFFGPVMHARMKPVTHRFSYRVYSLLVDLDQLDRAQEASPVFSISRFNLMSFHERDHGPRDGSPLAPYARALFAEAGLTLKGGRILLLCYPRILGYVFDPLSVYFAYDDQDHLTGVLYEVRNTFGEHHTYVAPVRPGQLTVSGLRQETEKCFYVSPFNPVEMHYGFRVNPPSERVSVRILVSDAAGPVLSASFLGHYQEFSTSALLRFFLTIPLLTLKIITGIHYEALRLWIKGLRLLPRPKPPAPTNIVGDK